MRQEREEACLVVQIVFVQFLAQDILHLLHLILASSELDYITIATLGNAVNFGDLIYDRLETFAAVASHTRGVFGGGYTESAYVNN